MPVLLRLRGQPQPDSSFRATNPIVRRINRLFPAGQEKKRLQRRKITQPDFDTIACPPNFLKIIRDAGPHFAKTVAIDAPGTGERGVAHLLDEKFASGA
jgi:hypothetical protein